MSFHNIHTSAQSKWNFADFHLQLQLVQTLNVNISQTVCVSFLYSLHHFFDHTIRPQCTLTLFSPKLPVKGFSHLRMSSPSTTTTCLTWWSSVHRQTVHSHRCRQQYGAKVCKHSQPFPSRSKHKKPWVELKHYKRQYFTHLNCNYCQNSALEKLLFPWFHKIFEWEFSCWSINHQNSNCIMSYVIHLVDV